MMREDIPKILKSLSPTKMIIYTAIKDAAEKGAPCPSNMELCAKAGVSAGTASEIVTALSKADLITVTRGHTARIVMVHETGKLTSGDVGPVHWRDRGGADTAAEAWRLVHEEGLSHLAAAQRLGITPGGIGSAIGRYKTRLGIEEEKPRQSPDDVERFRVRRDPCFNCGVPFDRHESVGCKRWRPRG